MTQWFKGQKEGYVQLTHPLGWKRHHERADEACLPPASFDACEKKASSALAWNGCWDFSLPLPLLLVLILSRGFAYPTGGFLGRTTVYGFLKTGALSIEASLSTLARNFRMPGTLTCFPWSSSDTFCIKRLEISLMQEKLILSSNRLELETWYHWHNPKLVKILWVCSGMQSRASVQPTTKYWLSKTERD